MIGPITQFIILYFHVGNSRGKRLDTPGLADSDFRLNLLNRNRAILIDEIEAAQYLSTGIRTREKRSNDGFMEEQLRGNYKRECIEEMCSPEEYQETQKKTLDKSSMFYRSNDIMNGCNYNSEQQHQTNLKYICHEKNTLSCTSSYNKVECVCKPGYKQCQSDVCDDELDKVRCSTEIKSCEHNTEWEKFYGNECDCSVNKPQNFLDYKKIFGSEVYSDLHSKCPDTSKFSEMQHFTGKYCEKPKFTLTELLEQTSCQPCKYGRMPKGILVNDANKFKCHCPTIRYDNAVERIFEGRYCSIDKRPKIIKKWNLCNSNIVDSNNKAAITDDGELECTCGDGWKLKRGENRELTCMKRCGSDDLIWYSDSVCHCPKLENVSLLDGEFCERQNENLTIDLLNRGANLCNFEFGGNSLDIIWSKIKPDKKFDYTSTDGIYKCNCNSKIMVKNKALQNYHSGLNCMDQLSCSSVCGTETCKIDYDKETKYFIPNCQCPENQYFNETEWNCVQSTEKLTVTSDYAVLSTGQTVFFIISAVILSIILLSVTIYKAIIHKKHSTRMIRNLPETEEEASYLTTKIIPK